METLTAVVAYLVARPRVDWTLFCDTKDKHTRDWIDWWAEVGTFPVDARHFTRFLVTDEPQRDYDCVIADTDDDPILACIPDRTRVLVFEHTATNRSGAGARLAVRRFRGPAPAPVALPVFVLPGIRTWRGAGRRDDTVVVAGLQPESADWDALRAVARRFRVTVLTRRLAGVPADLTPGRGCLVRFSENAPAGVVLRAIAAAGAVLIPKAGRYVHDTLPGSLALALSLGRPVVLPNQVARH
ncbi:MAG: hypothetical protein AAFS07_19050, partial [Pseudomonadota bacterium]